VCRSARRAGRGVTHRRAAPRARAAKHELIEPRRIVAAKGERRAKAGGIGRRHAASQHLAAGHARVVGGRHDGRTKVAGAVAEAAAEAGADEGDLEAAIEGGSEGREGWAGA
jgi:hypothetical protein